MYDLDSDPKPTRYHLCQPVDWAMPVNQLSHIGEQAMNTDIPQKTWLCDSVYQQLIALSPREEDTIPSLRLTIPQDMYTIHKIYSSK